MTLLFVLVLLQWTYCQQESREMSNNINSSIEDIYYESNYTQDYVLFDEDILDGSESGPVNINSSIYYETNYTHDYGLFDEDLLDGSENGPFRVTITANLTRPQSGDYSGLGLVLTWWQILLIVLSCIMIISLCCYFTNCCYIISDCCGDRFWCCCPCCRSFADRIRPVGVSKSRLRKDSRVIRSIDISLPVERNRITLPLDSKAEEQHLLTNIREEQLNISGTTSDTTNNEETVNNFTTNSNNDKREKLHKTCQAKNKSKTRNYPRPGSKCNQVHNLILGSLM